MIPSAWKPIEAWQRIVANEVNPFISGYPFPSFDTAPADPQPGYTYFDTALNTVRTWGTDSAWHAHF